MSTLVEIEKAIATLPMLEQREIYRHLEAQFGRVAEHQAKDKQAAVQHFLNRWTGAGTFPVTEEESGALRPFEDQLTMRHTWKSPI